MTRVKESGVVVGFLLALWLPLLGMAFHLGQTSEEMENREMATLPSLPVGWAESRIFPVKFGAYFDDHFGFRQTLIGWGSILRVSMLGVSPNPSVIVGKDGWLFFAGERANANVRPVPPLTSDELEQWRRLLESRRDWLATKGIRYIFVIAPSKETIYPEYLPPGSVFADGPRRLDQLIEYMREHSNVEILDLRKVLTDAKKQHQVYFKYDTHWNAYGAFAGYQGILETAAKYFPSLGPPLELDGEVAVRDRYAGDLTKMLGTSELMTERAPFPSRQRPSYAATSEVLPEGNVTKTVKADGHLPRLVMFCDSFGVLTTPFLSEHFSRATYRFTDSFSRELVEDEHPDIVIQEMIERKLALDLPADATGVPPPAEDFQNPDNFEGDLDVANCGTVSGWVWDRLAPASPVTVKVIDGDTVVGESRADIFRRDLVEAGIGNGLHGFSLPPPKSLRDGLPHNVRVLVDGTEYELHQSPRKLICAAE